MFRVIFICGGGDKALPLLHFFSLTASSFVRKIFGNHLIIESSYKNI